jgi:long-chain acyl-CoA synthetase
LPAGLPEMGLRKGDRMLLYLTNSVQLLVAFLAAQKIGVVVVLVSPIYTSHEIEYMAEDSGAKTIICHDTNYGYVKEILGETGLEHVVVTNLLDMVAWPKKVVAALFDKAPKGKLEKGQETVSFKSLLKNPPKPPQVELDPIKDLSYILYTGGTTGFPKGVPGNHWGHTSYVNDITDGVFKGFTKEGEDAYIAINPLFHIMALGLFMAIGLNQGNTTVLMPMPQVDAIMDAIDRYQVRWMLGVPALYRMILDNDRVDQFKLKSLRYCYCGGDVLAREILARWKERVGVPIYQVYGSTEAGHITYSRLDAGDPEPMCIGLPLPSRTTKICDPESFAEVPFGEVGELLVTSKHTCKEYLNRPDETERSFVEIEGEIYYRTGDYVRAGTDGPDFLRGAFGRHPETQGLPGIGLGDRGGAAGSQRGGRGLRGGRAG